MSSCSLTLWPVKFKWLLILALVLFVIAPPIRAHEVKPSVATVFLEPDGAYRVSIVTNLEQLISGIGSNHDNTDDAPQAEVYNNLRKLTSDALRQRFEGFQTELLAGIHLRFNGQESPADAVEVHIPPVGDLDLPRESVLILTGQMPPGANAMTWAWDAAFGSSVLRVPKPDGDIYAAWLEAGEESAAIAVEGPPERSFWEKVIDYFGVGYTHILPKGLDHILFVVGLFLLSPKFGPLIRQITAFTIAHSVTLALGILGIVSISPAIVEPLIAASIAYVCLENLMTDRLHVWRTALVFGFGLLHGLGFAGVLSEIGLGQADFVTGLIAFNLGVEGGQISVVLICFAAVFLFMDKPWYRQRVTIPASIFIAMIAVWWTFERIFLT